MPEIPIQSAEPISEQRYREGRKVTWVSVGVNVCLTILQIGVGLLAHAQSLVADGFHSLSDLVADFLVLVANFHSRHPADEAHPYGHQRIETAASLALGLLLFGTGAAILWYAAGRLQHLDVLPAVAPLAFWTALATIAAKEGLFRYMLHVGERLRSPMLIANAWHARSDAASSLVAACGIGGSLLGVRWLDPLAAVIVGFMILRMGWEFAWESLRELMDEGLSPEALEAIRDTLRGTPGVLDVHDLRTRRMAHQALVDAHIRVDGRISVSEGHRIAESARRRIVSAHSHVLDVLVHVDPEDDSQPGKISSLDLPERDALIGELRDMLGLDERGIEKAVFHYLGEKVDAEVFLAPQLARDPVRMAEVHTRLDGGLAGSAFGHISLHERIAPR
ncbi:MAG TPA: cation diffusion facilitator family transporter [Rhodocyclaceae bacterium]